MQFSCSLDRKAGRDADRAARNQVDDRGDGERHSSSVQRRPDVVHKGRRQRRSGARRRHERGRQHNDLKGVWKKPRLILPLHLHVVRILLTTI